MKISKNILMWGTIALCSGALVACSDDKPSVPGGNGGGENTDPDAHTVGITTQVELKTKSSLILELDNGKAMNVWAKQFDGIESADLGASNLKAVNNGGSWTITPEVKVSSGQVAFMYAYYPYSESNTDPQAINIDFTKQEDVLYSGIAAPASYQNPTGKLNMKHAQSLLTINVKKEGYTGNGVISKIKAESELIATAGTINVATGKITTTAYGALTAAVENAQADASGIKGTLPSLWVAPFVSKDQQYVVKVTMTIDGKDFTAELPEVTMRTGWQYIFHAVLSGNGLVMLPDATEEYSLNKADDQVGDLVGHGVIVFGHKGGQFVFPAFTGDNVFGTILSSGGVGGNYSIGGSLDIPAGQTVTVETWNSTGFEIASFENIESIDLSNY